MTSNTVENRFVPDYAVPPGETLLEAIDAIGMTQTELAERTGRPKKTINGVIKGKVAITPDTALQLERVLGVSATFWSNLERQYQETLARLAERQRLSEQIGWLDDMPITAMAKSGWVQRCSEPIPQLEEILRFFGVASPAQWAALWQEAPIAFRKSSAFESNPKAVTAWLRRGEIVAQQIQCLPFESSGFRQTLDRIRPLTVEAPDVFQPAMAHLCAQAGVAVAFIPELPGTRVCGATRWLSPAKALIQLSLRYKTDDHLWFTFFHEAAHLLLHGKRDAFLEVDGSDDVRERDANRFAADLLVPTTELRRFLSDPAFRSRVAIEQFARDLGVAPGIVVGRLQHDGILPHTHLNGLKRRLVWASAKAAEVAA